MSKIVPIGSKLVKQATHNEGDCVCRHCQHKWQGSYPQGEQDFECPQCHTHHGYFDYPFDASQGDSFFRCNCGCRDFFIMQRKGEASAVRCRHCGIEAVGWFK